MPVTPSEVIFDELIALNAYSTWYNLPSGEKMVICLSNPAEPRMLVFLVEESPSICPHVWEGVITVESLKNGQLQENW